MTPRRTLRIFRRDRRIRYRGIIHENIWEGLKEVISEEGGEIGELHIVFDHFGHERNRAQKHTRNLPLLLEELKRNSENTYYLRHLGLAYRQLDHRSLAKEVWTKAINIIRCKEKREAIDSLPFIDFIKLLQHHGQPARLLLDEALDYFPDNPQLFFLNGRELLLERRPLEAIPYFKRLLRWGEEKDYDHSISYNSGIFDGYSLAALASCYFLLGGFEKSSIYYEQAQKYDLGSFGIKELLGLLNSLGRSCDHRIIQSQKELIMEKFNIKELPEDIKISEEEMRNAYGGLRRNRA